MSSATTAVPDVALTSLPIVPVGLRVEGRSMLIAGAGPIAARKAEAYTSQGAVVTVVAPEHCEAMDRLPVTTRIYREFQSSDLASMWLVVTATGLRDVDGLVYAEAERQRIWCNAADDPDRCSIILPAVSRRGPITIGIATGGASPAVASWLRRRVDRLVDEDTLTVAAIAARVRRAIRAAGHPTEVPGWADVLNDNALDLVAAGQPEELERRLFEAVVGP